MRSTKVFFSCSGVGILDRGIETFFREAFDGLRNTDGLDITLFKGAGEESAHEKVLWNVPRTGSLAPFLGKFIRRNGYVVEQLSTFPFMVKAIRKHRPDIIFYSDSNLGFQLFRWRKQIGVPFRLLFSNGGPCHAPFDRTDFVHQVAPFYLEEALAAGEPPQRHRMVPYGIRVPDGPPDTDDSRRATLRRRLNLPVEGKIVISVGWISKQLKRMDFVVNEVAQLPQPRPHLLLVGAMDDQSHAIISLAREKLGEHGFTARSVQYKEVATYYRTADVFTLASLQEGFGRVFLEALIHGLPIIAHNHPVMRFVLGGEGILVDLSKPGVLACQLVDVLAAGNEPEVAARRRQSVRARFSWPILAPQYRDMFYDCARIPLRDPSGKKRAC
ncbi:MAG: glycosyl transferase group 1 [Verrucomicrobia bacterium]|nr:MAG: glycosyl transferase group 1 [Verrucomicrobiota bacterium]